MILVALLCVVVNYVINTGVFRFDDDNFEMLMPRDGL